MLPRSFWKRKIEDAWQRRSVVWLMGVRRFGKTVLSRSLPDAEYFDCELPRVRRQMEDPERFLEEFTDRTLVLDEGRNWILSFSDVGKIPSLSSANAPRMGSIPLD